MQNDQMPIMAVFVIIAAILLFAAKSFVAIQNDMTVGLVSNCRVLDLQQQQLISGSKSSMRTDIRYLVITDKETFICDYSILNDKYNNSDLFFRLKIDSVYTFRVAGTGKSFINDYRNILEIVDYPNQN